MSAACDVSRRTASAILGLLLLGRLVLGFTYSALNPLGEAPDEADHYAYSAYIGTEGRLPVGPEMTQAKHPPLYHILAAALARAAGAEMDFTFLRSNPDGGAGPDAAAPNFFVHTQLEAWPWRGGALAMHLGRLVSVLAGVVLVAATYALGRAIWPRWYGGPLAAAALVAFMPESLFIGGAMSNDMLAAMWCTVALWLGLRTARPGRSHACRASRGSGVLLVAILSGIAMGLAFLTKVSTAGLWPVVCAAILIGGRWPIPAQPQVQVDDAPADTRHAARPAIGRGAASAALAGVVALLFALPWLWRNQRLYGDFLGWPLVLATIDRRQGPLAAADLLALARGWFVSFWGKTGAAGHLALPWPFYALWILLVLAALLGWATGWRRRDSEPAGPISPAGWVVLLGAPVMTVLSILSYSRVALGTDQGRLLFPALAPVALLLVRGVAGWLRPPGYRWLPVGMIGGMAAIGVLALITGVVQPFAPPPPAPQAELAAARPSGQVFGGRLELLALQWQGAAAAADGQMAPGAAETLTLYWRALEPLSEDLRTTLRLTDEAGDLAWEWKRSPAAGRYSTDRWPVGRLVRDTYLVPSDALARAERIELGVRPFLEGDWLPPAGHPASDPFVRIPGPGR